jgi:DNA recombination protein RmuC
MGAFFFNRRKCLMEMYILILCGIGLLQVLLLVILLFKKNKINTSSFENIVKTEIAFFRKEMVDAQKSQRQELQSSLETFRETSIKISRQQRDELSNSLALFEKRFTQNINELTKTQREGNEKIRSAVETKLAEIQKDNGEKLEKMRETVDEKLHKTLETRLGESFKLVSERLELVQKGLGEMHTLATGVGDLKKVLSNVKTKGVLGEYQLGALLEQILTPSQYSQNVKTKKNSNDLVEYGVKIPSKEDSNRIIWLPIDAKFPSEDYERLMYAYDLADIDEINRNKKELERKIKLFAKDIASKYIDPPNTTDFAIMFLPFEGLFAEVLRIPSLFETVQREYKITITGPTTISAFLSSLQMGFRSLAVEKRTSEIWNLLGAVRSEFGKFGEVLEKTKTKLEAASKEIGNAEVRSRAIERKLKDVEEIPQSLSDNLLE